MLFFSKYFNCTLLTLSALSIATIARAEDIYVAQAALGGDTGANAANAHSAAFFNGPSSWSSPTKVAGRIGPGDTVHLVGNITTPLSVLASGTPGNVITILFEPGATMSVPAWPGTGAIALASMNYITIDGGTNGLIENTANGTNLATQIGSTGILSSQSSFVTIQNLTIQNLYVRVKGPDQGGSSSGIFFRWNGGVSFSNDTVNNCVFHDMSTGVSFDYGPGCSNFAVSNCTAYNCNWGGNAGDHNSSSSLDGLVVHDNHFYSWDNWTDTSASNSNHHNGFYAWSEQGGASHLTNVTEYNNVVGPGFNNTASTSGLFFSGNVGNILVYNNLFKESGAGDDPADGLVAIWIHSGNQMGARVYNNTFVGTGDGIAIWFYEGNGLGITSYDAENNIISNVGTAISQFKNGSASLISDYNNVSGLGSGSAFNTSSTTSSAFQSLTAWKALGFEGHSTTIVPVFVSPGTGDYHLGLTDLAAVDQGKDLSAYFGTDFDGIARPQGPAWDIGCYEQVPSSPVITSQPIATQAFPSGANSTMSVTARGAGILSYQWQLGGVNLSNGGEISGATTATLTLTGISSADVGNYTVTVSNGITPAATSNVSALVVGTTPVFTIPPTASQSVATGSTVVLTASATGTPTPTYTWTKNGQLISNGGVVSGASTNTLTLTGVTGVDAGTYVAVATNIVAAVPSSGGVLSVTGSRAPSIVTQPIGQSVSQGTNVTLTIVDAGTPAPSIQWYKGGAALLNGGGISGATSTTLTLTGVTPLNNGVYSAVASNGVGTPATSTGASLSVAPTPVAPTITTNPSSQSVGTGAIVVFTASASGNPAPSFQWKKNGSNLSDGGDVSGSATSVLTLSFVTAADNGTYTVVATNGVGSPALSSGANLTVTGVPPVITQQPTNQTVLSGSSVSFNIGETAIPPASIQWMKNGSPLADGVGVSGSTTATLTLSAVTTADSGVYSAQLSNGIGAPVSTSGATLTVQIPSRLVNISLRAASGPGPQTLITGFVIAGGSKSTLMRAVGPGLTTFGVTGVLENPELSLFEGTKLLQSDAAWGGTAALAAAFSLVGAFPLSLTSLDSALLTTIPGGSYTAQVTGANGGVALAEIYDADTAEAPSGRFINISARAQVGTGNGVLIAGFVVGGETSEKLLIRAVGPGLTAFGVSNTLAAPVLSLFDSKGAPLQSNTGWGGTAALQQAFTDTGAFALSNANADSALIATVTPGSYTAVVSGLNGTVGVALVEIYEIP